MNPWVKLLRPENALMAIIATFISGLISLGTGVLSMWFILSLASLSVILVMLGGNAMNDLFDIENDKINHPNRPLVTGKISINSAKTAIIISFIASTLVALIFISYISGLIVILAELLLFSYEYTLKRSGLPGNIVISVLVGLIFIFGGIAVDHFYRMIILFFLATFSNISRELIKDVEDMNGDFDRLTFPKRYGRKTTLMLSSVFIVTAVILSFVPYFIGLFSIYYLIPLTFCDILFIVTAVIQFKSVTMAQKSSKISMILGLVSFAVGGLTLVFMKIF